LSAFLFLLSVFVCGCGTLPPRPSIPDVYALPPASCGTLAEVSREFTDTHELGECGFLLLARNDEALKWRLALIDNATSAIDVQYFLWSNDEVGLLLFDGLLKAADRGVRVRLLVDDFYFSRKDRNIAAISMHPNFDISIFNPGRVRKRGFRASLEFLFNLKELNRRMHNKLLIVDNQIAIVGGRNISNSYFGLSKKYNYRDLDVLVVGPVIEQTSHAFDEYWNSDFAYPGIAMSGRAKQEDLDAIRENVSKHLMDRQGVLESYPNEPLEWKRMLRQLPARMETGPARFLHDEPVKMGREELRLTDMLRHLAEPSHEELIVVAPYFIPDNRSFESLNRLISEGVKVKVLTGSLGSNNQPAAHAHYKKYRKRCLAVGAELYEFRHDPSATIREMSDVPPIEASFMSLHMKVLVGDRVRCFIGSLNLDPRAIVINTENGLYIECPELSRQVREQLNLLMSPDNSWRVFLNDKNKLRWESSAGIVSSQPARNFWQRIPDFFYGLLPIEKQL
jgi:putative cardiolipin synthase